MVRGERYFQNINPIMSYPCFKPPVSSSNPNCACKALNYWAPPSSAVPPQATLPHVLFVLATLTFQTLDHARLSLTSGHLRELFHLLGLLFVCLRITSFGKAPLGGAPSQAIPLLPTQTITVHCLRAPGE